MFGAQYAYKDPVGSLQVGAGARQVALVVQHTTEVAEGATDPGVLGSNRALQDCAGAFEMGSGAGEVALIAQDATEAL